MVKGSATMHLCPPSGMAHGQGVSHHAPLPPLRHGPWSRVHRAGTPDRSHIRLSCAHLRQCAYFSHALALAVLFIARSLVRRAPLEPHAVLSPSHYSVPRENRVITIPVLRIVHLWSRPPVGLYFSRFLCVRFSSGFRYTCADCAISLHR